MVPNTKQMECEPLGKNVIIFKNWLSFFKSRWANPASNRHCGEQPWIMKTFTSSWWGRHSSS